VPIPSTVQTVFPPPAVRQGTGLANFRGTHLARHSRGANGRIAADAAARSLPLVLLRRSIE
jgi:hypothetical protein